MGRSLTLPTVAILSLVGAGLGIHLGRSAVSEISPLAASAPSFAKYSAYQSPDRPSRPGLHSANEVGAGSDGHGPGWKEYRPESALAADLDTYVADEQRPYAVETATPLPEEVSPVADRRQEQIERYAYYAVAAEEAEDVAPAEQVASIAQ